MVIPDPCARACLTAEEAFAELGVDRTTGYRAIREGTFPVPVIRVGRLIHVPTAALIGVLALADPRIDGGYSDGPSTDTPASPALRLVARPERAQERTQVATRPDRSRGHS